MRASLPLLPLPPRWEGSLLLIVVERSLLPPAVEEAWGASLPPTMEPRGSLLRLLRGKAHRCHLLWRKRPTLPLAMEETRGPSLAPAMEERTAAVAYSEGEGGLCGLLRKGGPPLLPTMELSKVERRCST